ncbi:MAG: biopolymer transporter ExbD [Myxococcota bacterium]|nr:biopolymer transporter ExbD [Myxococcota bacterium]MDW8362057.1 biopolymer transporter ExbD [Myxococcales bacterium]
MRSLSRTATSRPRPVMNVTPLVDIVLVLLIIFMVVIPAMEKNAQVEVPSIVHVDEASRQRAEPFTLSVTADGAVFFEERRVPLEGLEPMLREAHERAQTRKVLLRADRRARWQTVRDVFAVVQRVGFPGIALRVNQRGSDRSGGADGV